MKKTFVSLMVMGIGFASAPAHANSYITQDYCREYTRTIYVGGKPQEGYGTACLQPDGSWQIVNGDNIGQKISASYIVQEPVQQVYHTRYYPATSFTSVSFSFGNKHGRDHHYRDRQDWKHGSRRYGWDDRHHHYVKRSGNRLHWR